LPFDGTYRDRSLSHLFDPVHPQRTKVGVHTTIPARLPWADEAVPTQDDRRAVAIEDCHDDGVQCGVKTASCVEDKSTAVALHDGLWIGDRIEARNLETRHQASG